MFGDCACTARLYNVTCSPVSASRRRAPRIKTRRAVADHPSSCARRFGTGAAKRRKSEELCCGGISLWRHVFKLRVLQQMGIAGGFRVQKVSKLLRIEVEDIYTQLGKGIADLRQD